MRTSRLRLRYLFDRYYSKTATPKERDELFAVINAGATDDELSLLIRQAWDDLKPGDAPVFSIDKTNLILSNILGAEEPGKQAKDHKNIFLWAKIAVAAISLVLLTFGAYNYLRPKHPVQQGQIVKVKRPHNDALPGGNKAVLTLANGKTIILDNAGNGTLAKDGSTLIKKTADGRVIYNTSALATVNTAPTTNTITTPRGGQYQVVLPDGTQVWLNSASSLSFPTRFTGKLRQVEITGEAYFEVTKNPLMPFNVKTNKANIRVLGTHFNVMAYDDEVTMKTTLLEGAVDITSGTFTARLKPGQQAQIKKSGQNAVIDNVDVDDETAWKDGIFQFREVGIDAILRQAARWYDVQVAYNGKIPDRKFTGRISRNVKASVLLDILRYTGVDLKIEGNEIIVL
ncbi:FecR family protein [Mucilaginibacter lutimaris]|uniref:FecR family protein n=1 Tax=Mucilaginibacter lutimaris TaxID=931629 RepID=A0ABW2ZGN7_9SPHI